MIQDSGDFRLDVTKHTPSHYTAVKCFEYRAKLINQKPQTKMMTTEDAMDTFKYVLLGVNAVLFIALVTTFATAQSTSRSSAAGSDSDARKTALLVTAHPDDESMFFLPLVHSLTAAPAHGDPKWQLHLLCLSRGNFDGLGAIREKELHACGRFLGISQDAIHVVEDAKLQDGMQEQWSRDHVAQIVLKYMDTHHVDAVFTFDSHGVSGHANHVDVHFGVKKAVEEQHKRCATTDGGERQVHGWALESTNILRKYIGVLDALVMPVLFGGHRESTFVFLFRPWWNYQAMALHHSQFVWYRRLFVAFSRYTFINTFVPLVEPSAEEIEGDRTKKTQ